MLHAVFAHPLQDGIVIVEAVSSFFERVRIELQEGEQMFIEADGLVVVAVEKPFAMKLGLIDQTRQMDITTQLLVRTARMQLFAFSAAD